jgi:hypothetical protein
MQARRKLLTLEVIDDDGLIANALIAAQQLSPFDKDNPNAIKKALERVIEIFVLENTE